MKTSRRNSWIVGLAAIAVTVVAFPGRLPGQSAAAKPSSAPSGSPKQWSVQVHRVDPGDSELAYSFQVAIYENLTEELNKTKQFERVLREGDRNAGNIPNLLILKTTVEKYTPGDETRRAVTTVSGATKLTVRCQLVTRDDKIVLERTVNGQVRFFGSNMQATHNLAHNVAKAITQSSWSGSEQPSPMLGGQL